MTNTAIKNISSISEIMKAECEERNFKDINLKVFSDGVGYIANKLFMCFNGIRSGYFIMLNTDKGALVSTDFNSIQAESEFSFLSMQDSAVKEGLPVLVNFFSYTLYKKPERSN